MTIQGLKLDPSLSTPLLCDACLRLDVPLRLAPSGLATIPHGARVVGPVLPARHTGSVDVFLEAIGHARPGDVLVIDNDGRHDEGCVGDLTALEAKQSGVAGIVLWGAHRDTEELERIGLPIFSYGTFPAGPRRLDPRPVDALETARFGDVVVSRQDIVAADGDGAVFIPRDRYDEVVRVAGQIYDTERHQADAVLSGRSLRDQLDFSAYLERRAVDPSLTLRRHLRSTGGAIEE